MSCDNPGAAVKEDVMLRRPNFDRSKNCVKCKENQGNIVIRHAVFCKTCFFAFVTAKFKKALDPHINEQPDASRRRTLKASGNLLLGFSGGLGSTVLMDIVNDNYLSRSHSEKGGKNHPRNEQVWSKVYVCYVETCAAFPGHARDRTEQIREAIKQYDTVEFVALRIEDAFDPNWWARNGGDAGELSIGLDVLDEELPFSTVSDMQCMQSTEALRLYLSSLPTQTATTTTIQVFVRRLLLHTAQFIGASHLLLGTSLTSLSIAHISSIAQGGGFSVQEEAQEEWTPVSSLDIVPSRGIRVIRPLRDVGMKECGIWAWWRDLRIIGRDRYLGGKQDISALTRDFIIGLEADFPSTVSTIARTCAKVEPKEEAGGVCAMCDRPAQRNADAWKSRISIRDYLDPADPHLPPPRPPHDREKRPVFDEGSYRGTLTPHLCYSCHTTLLSKSSRGAPLSSFTTPVRPDGFVPMPVWVNAKVRSISTGEYQTIEEEEAFRSKHMGESSMREAIKGFLLTD